MPRTWHGVGARAGASVVFFFFQAEDGIRDYKVTGVQTCALPISLELHWVLEALRVVGHAVLADRGALGAVRAEVDRRVEYRLVPGPDAVLYHRIDRAAHRAVRADRALDLDAAAGLVLRLGGADHAVGQLRGRRRGARGHARTLEEGAPVHGFGKTGLQSPREARLGRWARGPSGQQHGDLLRPSWCGSSCLRARWPGSRASHAFYLSPGNWNQNSLP